MGVSVIVRFRVVVLGGEVSCERFVVLRDSGMSEKFVVLRMLINSVVPVGRALISPSTLLMAGDEAMTKTSLMDMKIKEYHMRGKDML